MFPEEIGDGALIQHIFLPFPAAEVHNQKPIVFVSIDMMKEIERGGPVFIIEALSSFFVSNMKPNLEK